MTARRTSLFPALAALLVAAAALGAWLIATAPATWRLTPRDGRPSVNGVVIAAATTLREGDWVDTEAPATARLRVAGLGFVEVGPDTRLRVLETAAPRHRLFLEQGRITAHVSVEPELFRVETPSVRLIGYGGTYTIAAGAGGSGLLRVSSGWAALEWDTRQSYTPAGAACPVWAGIGPGVPYFEDASAAFREALTAVDTQPTDSLIRRIAVDVVLSEARPRDALTLWHLGGRIETSLRGLVLDRLARLSPPPRGVTREGMIDGQEDMRDRWFATLGLGPGPWQRTSPR